MSNENAKAPDKGWRYNRVRDCKRELAFSELWDKECTAARGVDNGESLPQGLFIKKEGNGIFQQKELITKITNRDRMVIATIIQWLGSNVGFDFLNRALKQCGYKIVKEKNNE